MRLCPGQVFFQSDFAWLSWALTGPQGGDRDPRVLSRTQLTSLASALAPSRSRE